VKVGKKLGENRKNSRNSEEMLIVIFYCQLRLSDEMIKFVGDYYWDWINQFLAQF